MNTLLPIGTRVKHDGHGFGTIVGHNGTRKNVYVEGNLGSPEVAMVVQAGLGRAIVNSFYSGDRFPYVVHFDPSERYPEGYKDVYDVDGSVMVWHKETPMTWRPANNRIQFAQNRLDNLLQRMQSAMQHAEHAKAVSITADQRVASTTQLASLKLINAELEQIKLDLAAGLAEQPWRD